MKYLMCFLKSMLVFGMLFLFLEKDLSAQNVDIRRSHAISASSAGLQAEQPATGTLNVVAIMVEFQADSNRFTSGTGVFGPGGLPYLENAEDIRIEPLPHNRAYFEAHLEFAKNYYEKASDGQLTLNYRVLPKVYKLDQKMEAYSPTGETFTNEKIAYLAQDAWAKVEEQGGFDATGLDPENTAFIIFHAGVGRDIELTGTSLTITPQDIPSLYLRKSDLGNLLDNPGFEGFPVNNGSFRITNSMILPRTESRRGLDITDTEFVFPLSINGLLCASIGSHLGLPDLFNVEDGSPAIGRFGLMDGAGFFSYNGLLPPEPSAWEKIFLGWQTPFQINSTTPDSIELQASSLNSSDNIARYNLSATEYFLVENRHRDPDGTGVTLTIRNSDGTETQQTFNSTNDTFVFQDAGFDTLFAPGVIVHADNFDFSLPGGLDFGNDDTKGTADDRILNGGILIWHIDEAVIQANLAAGTINTNRFRRGVDLEEADGAQDIGPGIPGALNNSAAFGTAFDFWWSGNNYYVVNQNDRLSLYENRFGPDTYPDNNSNTGARSYFEFYDFSDNQVTASFKVRPIVPDDGPAISLDTLLDGNNFFSVSNTEYGTAFPLALSSVQNGNTEGIVISHNEGTGIYDLSSGEWLNLSTQAARPQYPGYPLVTADRPSNNGNVRLEKWTADTPGAWVSGGEVEIPSHMGLLSSANNLTLEADLSTFGINLETFTLVPDYHPIPLQQSAELNGSMSFGSPGNVTFSESTGLSPYPLNENSSRIYTGTLQLRNGNTGFFILLDDRLIMVNPEHSDPFKTIYESSSIGWPAIADFDNDGGLDFIFTDYESGRLIGINQNGGYLNRFPYEFSNGNHPAGTPLVADLEGDGFPDLIVAFRDSISYNIRILDQEMQPKTYSPLYVGGFSKPLAMPLNPVIYQNELFAISEDGDLKSWKFENLQKAVWPYKYGNHPYNKVGATLQDGSPSTPQAGVLNNMETYNWPNPADEVTHIRFEVAAPGGKVEIRVINLSGRVVYENTLETPGGFPQEVEVDTEAWGNGGYFALIKATVNGKTESKLVKIGVVH